jgi:predicted N-acetyltransferase YhbS
MRVRYRFKRAETENEFEQIYRLNHSIFAGELAQHPTRASGLLVDKFHEKNLYLIALADDNVVGMVALHDQPPFSMAAKLADPEKTLEPLGRLIECRLLAVEPAHRNGRVMAGLMLELYKHARHYDSIVVSGHADKAAMYRELGYRDLGPPVRSGEATYIPMTVRTADLAERQARWERHVSVAG